MVYKTVLYRRYKTHLTQAVSDKKNTITNIDETAEYHNKKTNKSAYTAQDPRSNVQLPLLSRLY